MPKKRLNLHWTLCLRYRSVIMREHRPVAIGKISLSLEAFQFERENISLKRQFVLPLYFLIIAFLAWIPRAEIGQKII